MEARIVLRNVQLPLQQNLLLQGAIELCDATTGNSAVEQDCEHTAPSIRWRLIRASCSRLALRLFVRVFSMLVVPLLALQCCAVRWRGVGASRRCVLTIDEQFVFIQVELLLVQTTLLQSLRTSGTHQRRRGKEGRGKAPWLRCASQRTAARRGRARGAARGTVVQGASANDTGVRRRREERGRSGW